MQAQELADVSEFLLRAPIPWVRRSAARSGTEEPQATWWLGQQEDRANADNSEPIPLTPDATFSALCLLGTDLEKDFSAKNRRNIEASLATSTAFTEEVRNLLIARVRGNGAEAALSRGAALGLNQEQWHLVERWVKREITFVEYERDLPTEPRPSALQASPH